MTSAGSWLEDADFESDHLPTLHQHWNNITVIKNLKDKLLPTLLHSASRRRVLRYSEWAHSRWDMTHCAFKLQNTRACRKSTWSRISKTFCNYTDMSKINHRRTHLCNQDCMRSFSIVFGACELEAFMRQYSLFNATWATPARDKLSTFNRTRIGSIMYEFNMLSTD